MKDIIGFISAFLIGSVFWVPIAYWFDNFIIAYLFYVIVFMVFLQPFVKWFENLIFDVLKIEKENDE